MLTVTTAAADRNLLTLAELRSAVGKTDGSADASLVEIGKRISAQITKYCRVPADGVIPPTLRQETLTETFRSKGSGFTHHLGHNHSHNRETLRLSRFPIVDIVSVTEAGTLLDATGYERADSAGLLRRLRNDHYSVWCEGTIIVVYKAGWAVVPDDLKLAATKMAVGLWTAGTRDPNLKSVEVVGVSIREYWVPPTTDPAIPSDVMDMLAPYRIPSFG